MKSWFRSVAVLAAGLVAGTTCQAQSEPSKHPLEPAGYQDPPSMIPTFSDIFPAQQPLMPSQYANPSSKPVQYEAEPDINGKPKIYHEPDPCPRYPVLYRIFFGDAIFDRAYLTPSWTLWSIKNGTLPFPVATTSISGNGSGVIGDPDTQVLLGNSKLNYGTYSGFSLTGGAWFAGSDVGLESTYFTLGKQTVSGSVNSNQYPVLARPFYDTNIGGENSEIISLPGFFPTGSVSYASSSQMWGVDLSAMIRLLETDSNKFDLLVGGRYLRLQEDLYISSTSTGDPIAGVVSFNGSNYNGANTVTIVDGTSTVTQFYGGTVGGRWTYSLGQFSFNATGKISLGESQSTIEGLGSSTLNPGVGQSLAKGGILVVGLNNTVRQQDKIAWMPEIGAGVSWTPLKWLSLNFNYDFMYLSRVVRPGDQFDRVVNPTMVPTSPNYGVPFGPGDPTARVQSSDIWFNSYTFGITFRF